MFTPVTTTPSKLFVQALTLLTFVGCIPAPNCVDGECTESSGPSDSLWEEEEGASESILESEEDIALAAAAMLPQYVRPIVRVHIGGTNVVGTAVVISRNTALISRLTGIVTTSGGELSGEYYVAQPTNNPDEVRPLARVVAIRGRAVEEALPFQLLVLDRTVARRSADRATLSTLNIRTSRQLTVRGYETTVSLGSYSVSASATPSADTRYYEIPRPDFTGVESTATLFSSRALVALADGSSASGGLMMLRIGDYRGWIDGETRTAGRRTDSTSSLPLTLTMSSRYR